MTLLTPALYYSLARCFHSTWIWAMLWHAWVTPESDPGWSATPFMDRKIAGNLIWHWEQPKIQPQVTVILPHSLFILELSLMADIIPEEMVGEQWLLYMSPFPLEKKYITQTGAVSPVPQKWSKLGLPTFPEKKSWEQNWILPGWPKPWSNPVFQTRLLLPTPYPHCIRRNTASTYFLPPSFNLKDWSSFTLMY